MFTSRVRAAWRQQAQAFRRFSTEQHELPPLKQPKTKFQKVVHFIGNNKQQLLNVLAVYFVFSFSVHNLRMQDAWKEQEKLVNDLKAENARLKDGFDDIWFEEAQAELKTSKNTIETLRNLIQKAHTNERITDNGQSVSGKKDVDVDEFAALASAVTASSTPVKGKMF